MSKRTSDSKVKAPLSALAARRLRQQQQAAAESEASSINATPNNLSPAITPVAQPSIASENIVAANGTIPSPSSAINTPVIVDGPAAVITLPSTYNEIPTPRQVSNFTQTKENYQYDAETEETTVKLRRGETLAVQGEYRISVVSGTISIGGAMLESSASLDVLAPATQAIPMIECASRSKKRKIEPPSTKEGQFDAVFSLRSIRRGLGDIGRICPRFDRICQPALTSTTIETQASESFTPILASIIPNTTLTIPPTWTTSINSLTSIKSGPKVIFIVGAKSVGKSTFSRLLLNAIVSQSPPRAIAYLDLDPGQPSFTPSCMVSLHKLTLPVIEPAFGSFQSTELLRQHHIGYTSPREDPKYYLRCAADLVRCYRGIADTGEAVPLIVNTCGWVKGMGRELLQELVTLCEPSDVVGIGDMESVFAEILPQDLKIKKHLLEAGGSGGNASGGSTGQQFTPADLRTLQTISYFHSVPKKPGDIQAAKFDFSNHLTAVRPLVASYKRQNRAIDAITVLDADISNDLLVTAINATIVAINLVKADDKDHPITQYLKVAHEEEDHENVAPHVSSARFDGTTALLPPEGTITAGLAIVRGVDEEAGEMHLLTPLTEDQVTGWVEEGYRIVLSRGRDEMPVWLMWDWREGRGRRRDTGGGGGGGAAAGRQPYLDFVVGGQVTGKGAKEWKVRRNIMRKSQQKR